MNTTITTYSPIKGGPPLRIGNYRIGQTLGVGTFGKVKLAYHEITGHKVAIKILNREKIKGLSMESKIKREIQILKLFRHPHIIKLYEVIETPTDIFMVMEYVSGGELFEYIVKHGKLSEDEARKFFQQLIASVDHFHRNMVVHRDLKPENVLLDSHLNVKIADFGLSNLMRDGDLLKTSCGTPNYAAPEVISGQLYAGEEVDVWSCGVILYALLCAKLPFYDDHTPALFKKIQGGIFTFPDYVSEECQRLIGSMLVVDPLKRSTIHEIKAHPWYQKNLPAYLKKIPRTIQSQAISKIDEDVLNDLLLKFGITMQTAIIELQKENGEANHLQVAYHLINDHKHNIAQPENNNSLTNSSSFSSFDSFNSPPMNLREEGAGGNGKCAHSAASQMWRLGITSSSTPKEIMRGMFRILQENNLEWKCVGPYHIRCRTISEENRIKIVIQLFKVKDGKYLLDIKKLEGEICPFFELCANLKRDFVSTSSDSDSDDDKFLY